MNLGCINSMAKGDVLFTKKKKKKKKVMCHKQLGKKAEENSGPLLKQIENKVTNPSFHLVLLLFEIPAKNMDRIIALDIHLTLKNSRKINHNPQTSSV